MVDDLVSTARELAKAIEQADGERRERLERVARRAALRMRAAVIGEEELSRRISSLSARLKALRSGERSGYVGFGMEFQNPVRDFELTRTISHGTEGIDDLSAVEQELEQLSELLRALSG